MGWGGVGGGHRGRLGVQLWAGTGRRRGWAGLGKDGGTELHGWLLDGSWGKLPGLLGGFAGAPGWQLEVVSGRAAGGGGARVWPQM